MITHTTVLAQRNFSLAGLGQRGIPARQCAACTHGRKRWITEPPGWRRAAAAATTGRL